MTTHTFKVGYQEKAEEATAFIEEVKSGKFTDQKPFVIQTNSYRQNSSQQEQLASANDSVLLFGISQ